ncbi:MAG: TRAP transporter large permease subunit, partial [Clostridia bacterium]|nr:TRAP transporter large permease subunit [Clostridia bacterium]
ALKVFCATFIIMIISLIPWSSLNPNWTFFEDFAEWLTNIPVIGTVIGKDITPFGDWYFNELSILVLVATFIIGRIMHYDTNKTIDITIKGAAGLVSTAFIVPLSRGIQVIMTTGAITPTVLHFGETTLSTLSPVAFVLVCLVFYFVLAIFIPSSSGLAAATMSIMAPLAVFAGVKPEIMILIYIMALGMVKMIMPTSIVVMTCSQVAHIDYGQWVKSNWKLVLTLFVACALILVLAVTL